MDTTINRALHQVLAQFGDTYFIDGMLNKNKIIHDLDCYHERLFSALLDNETIVENFTKQIGAKIIVLTNKLIELFEVDEFWQDSFTKYSKKIGLTGNGKFISEATAVVLDFPYKDTVLKASMSKEDVDEETLRPDEPFLNEVIAKEEIDVLLDKKIFVHAKKYAAQGVREVDTFHEADNLIIKGNNLLALHTLKQKYAGKVKMIYIDPPYLFNKKKNSDTFSYNSNFKTSTWLTFMKNRLEIARELLSDDGVIFVSIGNDGQAYLKLLMDDIFHKENYIETFIWRNTDNADSLGNKSRVAVEFVHAYEKVKQPQKKWIGRMSDNDDAPLIKKTNKPKVLTFPQGLIRFHVEEAVFEAGAYPSVQLLNDLQVKNGRNVNEIKLKGNFIWEQATLDKEVAKGTYFIVKTNNFAIRYQRKVGNYMAPEKFIDTEYLSKAIGVGVYEDSNKHLEQLNIKFTYSKPESLIAFFIRAVTEENDLVLDFFMGSGTTQAVAHKMNRQYIGIEQMDYIKTVTIPRLKQVIAGEQGGVSKDVEWQGGGSFVYVELMEKNRGFIKAVHAANTPQQLSEVFDFMLREAEIDFKVDLEKVAATLSELSLNDQKKVLLKIIDKNQLYYNYAEIDDEFVRDLITEQDYAFNKSFYTENE